MKESECMEYRRLANTWRLDHPFSRPGGVVLIWEGRVYGWKDELRHPEHERPGVIAVDLEGGLYKTEGGNDQDGARQWVPVDPDTPRLIESCTRT